MTTAIPKAIGNAGEWVTSFGGLLKNPVSEDIRKDKESIVRFLEGHGGYDPKSVAAKVGEIGTNIALTAKTPGSIMKSASEVSKLASAAPALSKMAAY